MVTNNNIAITFAEWLSEGEWVKRKATHPNKIGKYYSPIHCQYKTIEELYEMYKPLVTDRWFLISEDMPNDKQEVLAKLNFTGSPPVLQCVFVKRYCTDKVDWENVFVGVNGGLYPYHGVTEWMPMPK